MTTINYVEEILAGCPSKATLQWLKNGFTATLEDGDQQALQANLGLSGWITDYRRSQWNARIAECRAILKDSSTWSAAVLIAAEMERQSRSQRPPQSDFARLIREAITLHPGGPKTREGVYFALNRIPLTI